MLQSLMARLRGANDDDKGFTLIELLVVVLIIGILAAIALPTFLGQQDKAKDASAKSDVRNAVTQVESCLTDGTAVADCVDPSKNQSLQQFKLLDPGSSTSSSYTVSATSKATGGGTHTYTITKNLSNPGGYTYGCTTAASGCDAWKANGGS